MTHKLALITGGSRGLGRASALALAEKGNDIIITYQTNQEKADEVVSLLKEKGVKAAALQLDVSQTHTFGPFKTELLSVLEGHFNRKSIDSLINNAGFAYNVPFETTTEDQFDSMFSVHFKGVYFLTQTLLPLINDGGNIINFSTGLTRFTTDGYSAYAAMKGAVEVLTRYLAKELGPRHIRVNTLAPGIIHTDFHHGAFDNNPQAKAAVGTQIALGRMGEAEDIGKVVASLCADDMYWVTGTRLEASGGMKL